MLISSDVCTAETVKVPQMAESISEGTLKTWLKQPGDTVAADEEVATIETDKVRIRSTLCLGCVRSARMWICRSCCGRGMRVCVRWCTRFGQLVLKARLHVIITSMPGAGRFRHRSLRDRRRDDS